MQEKETFSAMEKTYDELCYWLQLAWQLACKNEERRGGGDERRAFPIVSNQPLVSAGDKIALTCIFSFPMSFSASYEGLPYSL